MPWWWREYPERDNEYICYYPPDIGPLSATEVWKDSRRTSRDCIGLYIHIPFCRELCPFCNYTRLKVDPLTIADYVTVLCQEIQLYSQQPGLTLLDVPFIYFGGGTPSLLSVKQFDQILSTVRKNFRLLNTTEISVEAHPQTADLTYLQALRSAGINRISFGLQSFQAELLERIGACHTPEQGRRAVSLARAAGFDNVALDLMFSLPEQSVHEWVNDLKQAIDLQPDHISCYRMMIDPAGPLGRMIRQGRVKAQPDSTAELEMANRCLDDLVRAGYFHYRSQASLAFDFARLGRESRYEIDHDGAPQAEYLPLGVGAFGYVNGFMYCTIHTLPEYLREVREGRLPILAGRAMTQTEEMSRFMVLGIKQLTVRKSAFQTKFGRQVDEVFFGQLQQLRNWGLIEATDDLIRVTRRGVLYMDNISKQFYSADNFRVPQPYRIQLQFWSKQFFGSAEDQDGLETKAAE